MRTKWLLLILAAGAVVFACRPDQTILPPANAKGLPSTLIIEYDVLNQEILSVKDSSGQLAKKYSLPRNGIPEIPATDGGPMGKITRVDVIKVLSDYASPGCVCYGSWCICN